MQSGCRPIDLQESEFVTVLSYEMFITRCKEKRRLYENQTGLSGAG